MYVHLVFSTKNREPSLSSPELRKIVFQHIKQNATQKDIWLDCINGWEDRAHCLVSLGREQSISKVAQLVKGEASFWINQNKLTENKFVWQDDYWALGVSDSHIEAVRKYIHGREEHHLKISFTKEVKKFIGKYRWSAMKRT